MPIGDLQLPLYPWGSLAPMLPQLAKAQSNVTASGIPSAIKPAGPLDFLNAMSSLSNVQSENALRQQQMGLVNTQLQAQQFALDLQQHPEKANALLDALMGKPTGGAQPAETMQSGAASATPAVSGRDLGGGMTGGGAISNRVAQTAAATNGDVDPRLALATADIESSMGSNLGSRGNIFQLGSNEWNSVGGGKMGEPETDIKNGVAFLAEKKKEMALALGRDPTPSEIYLAHQQGTTGALKLITNPDKTPQALGLGPAVANNNGNPNAPASAFVNKVDGLVQARLAKYAPPDTVESAPGGSTPAAQGYTGKVPTYEPAPPMTPSVYNLQSTPLAVHDAFVKYRQEGGQLPIEQFMASGAAPPATQPVRLAQNGPMPNLSGNLPPQGSMPQSAPQGPQMPPQMPGSLSGGFPVPTINGYSLYDLARRGTAAEFLKLPNMAKPMFEAAGLDPNFIYQKGLAEALSKLPTAELQARLGAIGKNAVTPEQSRTGALTQIPVYDAQGNVTGVRQLGYNPKLPEGMTLQQGPNGEMSAVRVPGTLPAIQENSTATAAGPAAFRFEDLNGPYGQNFRTTALNAAGMLGSGQGAASVAPAAPGGGNLAVGGAGGALPASAQQGAPGAPPSAQPAQRPESAAPTFPVQTPAGTKDISDVSVGDLFPGGQGIPQPPKPPPGATYGPASAGQTELQKKDADRVEQYGKESAENQKVYQDLSHIRDILQRGLTTSKIAPAIADLNNIAQGLGVKLNINGLDPNDAATLNKAATDLVFAQVKKLAGQVRVAEIEGYQKASPSMTIPAAANLSIINDMLSAGKWQDARARLAQEYLTTTGGAPLSAFESKFSQFAPLTDVTEHYKQIIRQQDPNAKFPGDRAAAPATSDRPSQTLGGVTYYRWGPNDWRKTP